MSKELEFDDIDRVMNETLDDLAQQRTIKAAKAKLNKTPAGDRSREGLLAIIKHYDETREWSTTASVALVNVQHCVCGAKHEWFVGWMREQHHRRFPNTRRLVAGKAEENFPARVELHIQRPATECATCLIVGRSVQTITEAA